LFSGPTSPVQANAQVQRTTAGPRLSRPASSAAPGTYSYVVACLESNGPSTQRLVGLKRGRGDTPLGHSNTFRKSPSYKTAKPNKKKSPHEHAGWETANEAAAN